MSVEVFPECPCFIMVMRSACTGDADVGGLQRALGAQAVVWGRLDREQAGDQEEWLECESEFMRGMGKVAWSD